MPDKIVALRNTIVSSINTNLHSKNCDYMRLEISHFVCLIREIYFLHLNFYLMFNKHNFKNVPESHDNLVP